MKKSFWRFSTITILMMLLVLFLFWCSAEAFASTTWSNSSSVDLDTHASIFLDFAHHEIHDGGTFTAYYALTTAATDGHRTGIYLKTPVNKEVHLIASFACSAAANAEIREAITLDANEGTHTTVIRNRNRNSSNTSLCLNNATVPEAGKITTLTEAQIAAINLSAGTVLHIYPLVAGAGPKPDGGASRETQEWILKKNTTYVFMLTNTAATANNHLIILDWYEHTNLGLPLAQ
jgi:hypothetical protein